MNDSLRKIALIDDDTLVHSFWDLCAKDLPIKLCHYFSFHDFIKSIDQFSKNDFFFFDSNISESELGEEVSFDVFKLGFENIYLVTGNLASDYDLEKYYWLKSVIGKEFPIHLIKELLGIK